jgi:hypothetical protein
MQSLKPNYFSLMQPGISPLFKTRAYQDSLMMWMDAGQTYGEYWKLYWTTRTGSQANFDKALQDGVIEPAGEMPNGAVAFAGDAGAAIAAIGAKKSAPGVEVVVYEKVAIGYGGAWSNNPWLLELPDPITRATWDNYLCVSPKRAKELDAELTGFTEIETHKRVAKTYRCKWLYSYTADNCCSGYAQRRCSNSRGLWKGCESVGRASASDNTGKGGKNAYPFQAYNGVNFEPYVAGSVSETAKKYEIAITQTHHILRSTSCHQRIYFGRI